MWKVTPLFLEGRGRVLRVLVYADGSEVYVPPSCISVLAGQDLGVHELSLSLRIWDGAVIPFYK